MSDIEWTDETWNPTVGCSRVSAGCEHCYAERVAHRGMSEQHRGLTVIGKHGPRWTGEVRFLAERLVTPLRWRKPRRVFVDSMSDLFHEGVSDEQIAAVFGVMAACPQHTFQVLTKRPERARVWFAWLAEQSEDRRRWIDRVAEAETLCNEPVGTRGAHTTECQTVAVIHRAMEAIDAQAAREGSCAKRFPYYVNRSWPLPNVWLGVSVEDQVTADERIPELLGCPAAVRFVSYEPALGPVDFGRPGWLRPAARNWGRRSDGKWGCDTCCTGDRCDDESHVSRDRCTVCSGTGAIPFAGLDWIIIGGESGPGARPLHVGWVRATIDVCRRAGVACFVKQLGAHVITRNDDNFTIDEDPPDPDFPGWPLHLEAEDWIELVDARETYQGAPVRVRLRSRKGNDPSEWRSDLRVREFPQPERSQR